MLTETQKRAAQAIVNIFETGRALGRYDQVTLLSGDSGHLTYGRAQTTLASGNLALLVRDYCEARGSQADALRPYLAALDACDVALDHDERLKDALRAAGADPVMRTVQDAFFDRVYWGPAVASADVLGLLRALSVTAVYDGRVHGSFDLMRKRTTQLYGAPSAIGEAAWVQRYVDTRRDWLATHPNTLLRKTVYRMDALSELIAEARWDLDLPLRVRGVLIDASTFGPVSEPPIVVSAASEQERVLRLATPPMQGQDVRELQDALGMPPAQRSGVFDAVTDAAVRNFQDGAALKNDGRVGPATWSALRRLAPATNEGGAPVAVKEVILDGAAGDPKITVFIGQAQFGTYHVYLKDPQTNQRVERANGDNADDVDDTFQIGVPLAQLNGQFLSWWVMMSALGTGPGQLYFARVSISQRDKLVSGGSFEYSGPLDNTQNVIDFVRLTVR